MKQNKSEIVLACGGTGGHVYPALALAQELKNAGRKCHFVGRLVGMERELIGDQFSYWGIPAYPLKRGRFIENLTLPFRLIKSYWAAHKTLMKIKPAAVIGTGGYVSLPTLIAAGGLRIPVFLQEQNLHAGIANKIASKFARAVYVAGEDVVAAFPPNKCEVLGNPTREIPQDQIAPDLFTQEGTFNLLVLGGSQGAKGVNDRILRSLQDLSALENLRVVWQCGKSSYEQYRCYDQVGKIQVSAFLNPIYPYMANADLIVSRSGASTLTEILAFGKAAIYIPFPHAAENHQLRNAESMLQAGAAFIEEEKEEFALSEKILTLYRDSQKRIEMSQRAVALYQPNSAQKIIQSILNHLGEI